MRGGIDARGGHQRFAAAHVALQKAVHRRLFREIPEQLPGGAPLRARGREGQRRPKRLERTGPHRRARARRLVPAQQQKTELKRQQLLENQPSPRGVDVAGVLREMDFLQRLGLAAQTVFLQQRLGQRLVDHGRGGQRRAHTLGEIRAADALRQRVNGNQRRCGGRRLGQHFRVYHLARGQHAAHLAKKQVGPPDFQLFGCIRIVEIGEC